MHANDIPQNITDTLRLCSKEDIELARRKLDWEPRIPIEEGLTRTLRYFEERMRMENRAYPFMSWVEIM